MTPTMLFKLMPSGYYLVVHAKAPPSAAEWTAHVVEMEQIMPQIRGIIVISGGVVPDPGQRREVADMLARQTQTPRVAVVCMSTIERNVLTALSWIIGNPIRGFPSANVARAFDFVDVPHEVCNEVMDQARVWAAELGNPVVLAL